MKPRFSENSRSPKRKSFSPSNPSSPKSPKLPKSPKEVKDVEQEELEYGRRATWKSLFNFTTRKHLPVLLAAVFLSILAGVITPVEAILFGKLFKAFTTYGAGVIERDEFTHTSSKYCMYLCALGLGSWLFHGALFISWEVFGGLQAKSARDRLFDGLLKRQIAWFDLRKNGVGALTTRLQTQIVELEVATSQTLGMTIKSLTTAIASIIVAISYQWKLTLIIIASIPIIAIFVWFFSNRIRPNIDLQTTKLAEASKYISNAFNMIETVKYFNGQDAEVSKYEKVVRLAARYYTRQTQWNAAQNAFMQFATLSMFVQGFYFGSYLVSHGQADAGKVMTTFWAATMSTSGLMQVMPLIIVLEKGRAAGANLRAIMAQLKGTEDSEAKKGEVKPGRCVGDIEFKEVSFAYPSRPNQLAVEKARLFFPAGELTFVIGGSGSGKSTLSQLLMRFYEPASGSIFLDREPIERLDLAWVRSNITLVEQHSVLFNETIFRNIAFGAPDWDSVSESEVKSVVDWAILETMIEDLPNGLHTMVGQKGNMMSGGQRQRMALARARLRDSPILVLDESTSALDHITCVRVMAAIRRWRKGKTTIVITHDISQIDQKDFAFIMAQGKVVQEGYRKDMEMQPGSPFQSFLLEGEQAAGAMEKLSLDIGLKPKPISPTSELPPGLRRRGSRLNNAHTNMPYAEDDSADITDPIDTYLREREFEDLQPTGPSAMFSPVFANRMSMSAFNSPITSPISPIMTSFRPMNPSVANRVSRQIPMSFNAASEERSTLGIEELPPNMALGEVMLQGLETAMETTGTMAKQARRSMQFLRASRSIDISQIPIELQDISYTPVDEKSDILSIEEKARRPSVVVNHLLPLSAIYKTVWPSLCRRERVAMLIAVFAMLEHAVATPVFSFVFSKLLATFTMPDAEARNHNAFIYSMAILTVASVDGVASYFLQGTMEFVAMQWVTSLRLQAARNVLDQARQFFDEDRNSSSRMTEALDHHAEEMRNLVGRFTGYICVAIVMMTTAVVWSMIESWKLTLVGLSTAPVMYAITTSFEAVAAKANKATNDAAETTGAIFLETFTNIKTVRSLTLEGYFTKKYKDAAANTLRLIIKKAFFSGIFCGLADSAIVFVTALLFFYGGSLACNSDKQDHGVAQILIVFSQLLFGFNTVNGMIAFIPSISTARDSAARLLRLVRLPQDSHEHGGTKRIPNIGDIALHDVTFRYPSRPDQIILNDVNFIIPAGSCTAVVGFSGSGKSTIASLLLNVYTTGRIKLSPDPDIMFSGRGLHEIHTPTLRNLITIVSQTPVLFPATVYENIIYGLAPSDPKCSLHSVREAAKSAGVDDFLMSLSQGYDTVVGEGGMGLSGGQAQRISIARALVRKPDVLILDEATSALDVESAGIVRESIRNLVRKEAKTPMWQDPPDMQQEKRKGMTVIIITHSKDMMAIAESIIMMDRGRVVEMGGFEELKRKGGAFTRLLTGAE